MYIVLQFNYLKHILYDNKLQENQLHHSKPQNLCARINKISLVIILYITDSISSFQNPTFTPLKQSVYKYHHLCIINVHKVKITFWTKL